MFGREFDFKNNSKDVDLSGIKIAKVVNNLDPKGLERVFVRVLGVHDLDNDNPKYGIWAERIAPTKYQSGDIPDIGDYLYVIFPNPNDPMRCLWIGWVRWRNG